MRVSFDSNAWEAIFSPDDTESEPICAALRDRKIEGFICDAGFRIEAILRRNRAAYFAKPHMEVRIDPPIPRGNGLFNLRMSIGPDDRMHPGLPLVQAEKLRRALAVGVKLMSGRNWMGLPGPPEIRDRTHFIAESADARHEREETQLWVSAAIEERGVGKAMFEAADGWKDRPRTAVEEKQLIRACAEWADGELVAAHVAYKNDILCTNDRARGAGQSVFDPANRVWLETTYGVKFMSVRELVAKVAP